MNPSSPKELIYGLGWKDELKSSGQERILIVEDNEQVRTMADLALRSAGYRVITANDGDEAWQLLESIRFDIDLLITDLTMPGSLSGEQLIAEVQQKAPNIAAMLVTGFAENIEVESRVLLKPFRLESLLAAARAELSAPEL